MTDPDWHLDLMLGALAAGGLISLVSWIVKAW